VSSKNRDPHATSRSPRLLSYGLVGLGRERLHLPAAFAAIYWTVVVLVFVYSASPLAETNARPILFGVGLVAAVLIVIYQHVLPDGVLRGLTPTTLVWAPAVLCSILIELTGSLRSPFYFTALFLVLGAFFRLSRTNAAGMTAILSVFFLVKLALSHRLTDLSEQIEAGVRVGSLWATAFLASVLAREIQEAEELSRERDRTRRALEVLAAIRDSLSGKHDVKALLEEVVERVSFALSVPAAAAFVFEEEEQALVLTAHKGISLDIAEQVAVQRLSEGSSGLAARTAALGQPLVLDDLIENPLADDIREGSLLSGLRSMASFPLLSRGELVGVLQLFSDKRGSFIESSLVSLEDVAANLALVVDNVRLEDREKKLKAELDVLYGVTQRTSSSLTSAEVVKTTLEAIERLGYPMAAVLLFDDPRRELVLQPSPSVPREQWWSRIPVGEGVTGEAAKTGEVVVVADTARDPRYIRRGGTGGGVGGGKSEIAVPLKLKGRLIGVLDVERRRTGAFGDQDVRILSSFANQAATAIDSARLYEVERSRAEQLDALREYSTRIQTSQTESELVATLLHYLHRLVEPHQALVYRGTEDAQLEVVQHLGEPGRCGVLPVIDDALRCVAFRTANRYSYDRPTDLPCPVKSPAEGGRYYLCLPLSVGGEVTGVVHLDSETEGYWNEERVRVSRAFVNFAAPMLQNIRYLKQLKQRAILDDLTGLYNRRFLEGHLQKQLAMAMRYDQPLAILMVDIDHFKDVNDRFGHDAGDAVLRAFGERLSSAVRASDVVARWGGEEFVVVLPTTDGKSARALADKIRSAVEKLRFSEQVPELDAVTVSIGAAAYPEHGRTAEILLKSADLALYRAKEGGRNRVELAVF